MCATSLELLCRGGILRNHKGGKVCTPSCRPFHNQQTKPLQPKKQAVRASLALFLPPRYATTDQLARRRSRSHGAGVMAALAPNSRSHLAPHLAPHLAHMVMAEKTGLCLQMDGPS